MKTSPSLLPLLRSRMQGELLALVLLHPDREYSITELAEACGVSVTAVLREVERLTEGGILEDRRGGRGRLGEAPTDTPPFPPVGDPTAVTLRPLPPAAALPP